jgi:uncharacterized membrane protein YkoI
MKKVLLTTGLSLALIAGGALAVQAAAVPVAKAATVTSTPAAVAVNAAPEQADPTEAKDTEADSAAEQAQLQSQAKITAEQSKEAALKKISGTVQSVTLEDEDNTAVYNVAVKDSAGKIQEVKVNAQTGVVIKVDNSDDETQDNEGSDTETADDNK